jgi:hypothetical protein
MGRGDQVAQGLQLQLQLLLLMKQHLLLQLLLLLLAQTMCKALCALSAAD